MGRLRTEETSDLPPGILVRKRPSGTYYYYQAISVGGPRREYPLGKDKHTAIARWKSFAKANPPAKEIMSADSLTATSLYRSCKANARKRGIDFFLTLADVEGLLERSNGRCTLTGIDFDMRRNSNHRVRPWAPSIDRIDCKVGYTVENVRIVANSVNTALNDFGEEVLLRIARGLIRMRRGESA